MANHFASQWLPPTLRRMLNQAAGATTRFKGPYASWTEANNACSGYDSGHILARVSHATSLVLSGDASYEQDGAIFHNEPPISQALTAILLASALENSQLRVLDFGGGLGSHFLRWRRWLEALPEVQWCVVEQAHFVVEGTRLLSGIAGISFASSIKQLEDFLPNVVLASSVLQYLPEPLNALSDLASLNPKLIIIDRTPFSRDGIARVLSQHVPRSLGTASYPSWTLSHAEVDDTLKGRYRRLLGFSSADAPLAARSIRADYAGCVYIRKD